MRVGQARPSNGSFPLYGAYIFLCFSDGMAKALVGYTGASVIYELE